MHLFTERLRCVTETVLELAIIYSFYGRLQSLVENLCMDCRIEKMLMGSKDVAYTIPFGAAASSRRTTRKTS